MYSDLNQKQACPGYPAAGGGEGGGGDARSAVAPYPIDPPFVELVEETSGRLERVATAVLCASVRADLGSRMWGVLMEQHGHLEPDELARLMDQRLARASVGLARALIAELDREVDAVDGVPGTMTATAASSIGAGKPVYVVSEMTKELLDNKDARIAELEARLGESSKAAEQQRGAVMSVKVDASQVSFVFRPIERWVGGARRAPVRSQFKVNPGRTQEDLRHELGMVGVRSCVIQADLVEDDIRLDGMPRASARFRSERVVISFVHPQQGPVAFPCGTYDRFWHNVRAVVKTMEALRAVDRYGVSQRSEQYTGWRALPGGDAIVPWSLEEAARFLMETGGAHDESVTPSRIIESPELLRKVYTTASYFAHPDKPGGCVERMSRVNAARDRIREFQERAEVSS